MRVPPPGIVSAAQVSQHKYGILASSSLAQWADESGWGAKTTGAFNYFGVKAPEASIPGRMCITHEVVHGVRQEMECRFRDFASLQAAFDYHAALIATDRRYRAAYAVRDELEPYIRAMAPVYATAPDYAEQLLALINENRLAQYDRTAAAPAPAAAWANAETHKALGG